MFTNQVSIKDLFSSNAGVNSGRQDGSGDWECENSSSLSNSQQPYSQLDFPDSQELPGSQGYSQRESNTPSKFYQRYMAKGLHRENSQKTTSQLPKPTFQNQIDANKARARDRDERDLLNRMLSLLKDCGNEVKEAVAEVRSTLEKGSTSSDTRLAEYLSKIDASLSLNAAEYKKALEIKEKTKEENITYREKLNEQKLLVTELKQKIKHLEEEKNDIFVNRMEDLFAKNTENLKNCLELLYTGHKRELEKFASSHCNQHTELIKKHDKIATLHASSLQSLQDRIDHELSNSVEKILDESQKIYSSQGRSIVQFQQDQLNKLRIVIQKELISCMVEQMSSFKDEIFASLEQKQEAAVQQRTTEEQQQQDIKQKYTQEMEALKRRFQEEANGIYTSSHVQTRNQLTSNPSRPSSQYSSQKRDVPTQRQTSEKTGEYIGPGGYLSPGINVVDPVEIFSGRRSLQGDPNLRGMFTQNKDTVFKSPMSSLSNQWSSNLMYKNPKPSPVATVKPQVVTSKAKKGKPCKTEKKKQKAAPKKQSMAAKVDQYPVEPSPERKYPLRKRNRSSQQNRSGEIEMHSVPDVHVSRCQPNQTLPNTDTKMTHLARYSEIYTFESTPRLPVSDADSAEGYEPANIHYKNLPSVMERRVDPYTIEDDSPLQSAFRPYPRQISHWNNRSSNMQDERWEAAKAVKPAQTIKLEELNTSDSEDENFDSVSQTSSPCLSVYELVRRKVKKSSSVGKHNRDNFSEQEDGPSRGRLNDAKNGPPIRIPGNGTFQTMDSNTLGITKSTMEVKRPKRKRKKKY